jgi:hypothetical protein
MMRIALDALTVSSASLLPSNAGDKLRDGLARGVRKHDA